MNFVRSSIVPQTIASDTAAKANWKNQSTPGMRLYSSVSMKVE